MIEWKAGFPDKINTRYQCRIDGQELPLELTYCPICKSYKWIMDNGRDYIEIEEPVEWSHEIKYIPKFNRF